MIIQKKSIERTQRLAEIDFLVLLDIKIKIFRRFKNQHNSRSQVEFAKIVSLLHIDARIIDHQPEILIQFLRFIFRRLQISFQILSKSKNKISTFPKKTKKTHRIRINSNRTNVSSTHRRHGEKSIFPLAIINNAFVKVEQSLEPSRHAWIHAKQLARKVSSIVNIPIAGRVEPVVVARRQINDTMVHFGVVIHLKDLLVSVIRLRAFFGVLSPTRLAEERFKRIIHAFHLLQIALVHFTEMKHAAIARRNQIRALVDLASVWLQFSAKKLGQVLIVGQVLNIHLVQVALEQPRVEKVTRLAAPHGQFERVYNAPKSRHGAQRKLFV